MGRLFLVIAAFLGVTALATVVVAPRPPAVLKVATNEWLGYDPLYVARDAGLLRGDRVRLVALPSATEVIRALHHGALDAAALTLDEALDTVAAGTPLTVVAVADVSHGADAVLVHADVPPGASLRGRAIAYEGNAVGALVAARFLERQGLSLADVRLEVAPPYVHGDGLEAEHYDAVVSYEPFMTRLLPITRQVFSSQDIPGEVIDVLAVRSDRLDSPGVDHLLEAWRAGVARIGAATDADMAAMRERQGLSADELRAALALIRFPVDGEQAAFFAGPRPPLAETAARLWDVMRQIGLAPPDAPLPPLGIGRTAGGR